MPDIERLPILVEHLERAYRDRRVARIKPDTALILSFAVRSWMQHPSRDEIVKVLCGVMGPCESQCMPCVGKANLILRMFEGGKGLEG